jgi:hypothetical protein
LPLAVSSLTRSFAVEFRALLDADRKKRLEGASKKEKKSRKEKKRHKCEKDDDGERVRKTQLGRAFLSDLPAEEAPEEPQASQQEQEPLSLSQAAEPELQLGV